MPAALVVRLRPAGPWRLGPDNGAKDRTDRILHSDSLFSAMTHAMRDLGYADEWIAATVEAREPAVRLSSCYPYTGRTLLIQPPRSFWPVTQTGKVRWKAARFIPTNLVPVLLREEEPKEDQWAVDPVSECLLPVAKHGPLPPPFRVTRRAFAPVDRVTGSSEAAHSVACLQFSAGAGMWFAAGFGTDEDRNTWSDRVRSAVRLLADTGLGGGRSRGWGRSEDPRFESADLTRMLTGNPRPEGTDVAWWMISLCSPSESDSIDWKKGSYGICTRSGRLESATAWGELKPGVRMLSEGSVVTAAAVPSGAGRKLSEANGTHAIYRSGIAFAIPVPWKEARRLSLSTEEPSPAEPVAEEPAVVSAAGESEPPSAPEIEPPAPETPVQEPPQPEPPGEAPPPEIPPAGDPDPQPTPVREPEPSGDAAPEEGPSS